MHDRVRGGWGASWKLRVTGNPGIVWPTIINDVDGFTEGLWGVFVMPAHVDRGIGPILLTTRVNQSPWADMFHVATGCSCFGMGDDAILEPAVTLDSEDHSLVFTLGCG